MTEAELKAIEDRAEKATPGPWYHYDHGVVVEKDCAAIDEGDLQKVLANGDFIAFARTDVPALCAEVRKLREALEWYAGLKGEYRLTHGLLTGNKTEDVYPFDLGEKAREALKAVEEK